MLFLVKPECKGFLTSVSVTDHRAGCHGRWSDAAAESTAAAATTTAAAAAGWWKPTSWPQPKHGQLKSNVNFMHFIPIKV